MVLNLNISYTRTHNAPELLPSSSDASAAQADMLDTIVVGDLFNELGTLCYGYTEIMLKEFKQQPKRLGQVSAFLSLAVVARANNSPSFPQHHQINPVAHLCALQIKNWDDGRATQQPAGIFGRN